MSGFGQTSKGQSTPLSRFFSYVKRVLVGVAALLAVAYVGDYLAVRVRIATNHAPYGVVQVRRSYAVTMKNGKPEYFSTLLPTKLVSIRYFRTSATHLVGICAGKQYNR
ncbi:MAG TPA: hypothetical protein VGW37_15685 [Terriglobia bacterium]|nr:hypothetical protein [Terriglobia bacterium]